VTCCSGCFSAYRREAISCRGWRWENQHFLGVESTFGDDRSLTNCVLRDWRVLYEKDAISHTIVPSTFRAFVSQQTRWKRSWTRESLLVARFIWRKHPVAAFFTYLSIVLPLLAPAAALHAVVWGPIAQGGTLPLVYIAGIYSLAMVYSLYYVLFQDEYSLVWVYGVLFVFFYLGIMLWQTYYAIATCRTAAWGRAATAGTTEQRHEPRFRRAGSCAAATRSSVLVFGPGLMRRRRWRRGTAEVLGHDGAAEGARQTRPAVPRAAAPVPGRPLRAVACGGSGAPQWSPVPAGPGTRGGAVRPSTATDACWPRLASRRGGGAGRGRRDRVTARTRGAAAAKAASGLRAPVRARAGSNATATGEAHFGMSARLS
jgi:hypothetical protein